MERDSWERHDQSNWLRRGVRRSARAVGRLPVVMASVAMVFLAPTIAWAAPTPRENARVQVAEGAKLLDARKYEAALAAFEKAHAIFPSPKIHYNIGLAYVGMGRNAAAFTAFERFLREASDASPAQANKARAEIARLATTIAFISVACDVEGADVFLDGASVGRTPLTERIPVDAGGHDLVVRSPEFGSRSEAFRAAAGESMEVRVTLRPQKAASVFAPPPKPIVVPPPQPAPAPSVVSATAASGPSPFLSATRWIAAGAGLAGLAVGVAFNVRSVSRREEFDRQGCSELGGGAFAGPDRCPSLASEFRMAKRTSMIGYVAGGALATTAVVLFLLPDESGTTSAARIGTDASLVGATYLRSF